MMSSSAENLRSKIESQSALIGVIGLGYVGLPLIDAFFKAGFKCLGFDVDPAKVDALNAGQSYIAHISNEMVQQWVEQGNWKPRATCSVWVSRMPS